MPIATPAPNVTSVCEGFLLRPGASITSEVAAEPRLPSYGRLEAGHVNNLVSAPPARAR